MNNILLALFLTLLAGLSTAIGGLISILAPNTNKRFLSVALGFSAGVMIYVSMVEIFFKAESALILELGMKNGKIINVISFFAGMIIIAIIDRLIPSEQNPHEIKTEENYKSIKLIRMGLFTAIAIGVHNFPEGLATFISAMQSPSVAIPIVVAIAIHNIPEGIAVAMPIYHATGSKSKAFKLSLLSGLAEPFGAIIGFVILMPIMNDIVFGIIFAAVAGIMVFISIDELLPAAREYGKHHLSIYGMIFGMFIMAISLLMFV